MFDLLVGWLKEPEKLRGFIEASGPWGPLIFIGIQAAQVVLAPIPGEATGFLAGLLFGPWLGLLYAMIGLTIGSSLAFFLSRYFRNSFAHLFERSSRFKRLSRFMSNRGVIAAFFCFLFPGFPKDYLSYFLGLFSIPWPVFLIIMILGRLPATFALTLEGAAVYEKDWKLFFLVTIISVSCFLVFYLFRYRFYQYLEGKSADRLS